MHHPTTSAVPGCPGRGCPAMLHPLTTAMAAADFDLDVVCRQAEGPHVARLALLTEAQWQGVVLDLAALCGWRAHHETDSRRTIGGWPDLYLVRRGRVVVLELKKVGGKVSDQQRAWLHDLAAAGIECAVAGPGDLSAVSAALREGTSLPRFDAGPGRVLTPAEVLDLDRRRAGAARARGRW